jgi:DNA-binding CsgD family transcriptional regulator
VVTSVNRLVAARPYPVVHVEAPDPDIIMRRPATSERTMTPAMASKRPLRFSGESRPIQCRAGNRMRQPRSPVSTAPTSSDGASATALLGVVLRVLDTNSQLKGRLTLKVHFETLTPREREIIAFVASGRLNKQIAADLGVSEITVKVHRSRVMQKMRASSLPHLAGMADQLHLAPTKP